MASGSGGMVGADACGPGCDGTGVIMEGLGDAQCGNWLELRERLKNFDDTRTGCGAGVLWKEGEDQQAFDPLVVQVPKDIIECGLTITHGQTCWDGGAKTALHFFGLDQAVVQQGGAPIFHPDFLVETGRSFGAKREYDAVEDGEPQVTR